MNGHFLVGNGFAQRIIWHIWFFFYLFHVEQITRETKTANVSDRENKFPWIIYLHEYIHFLLALWPDENKWMYHDNDDNNIISGILMFLEKTKNQIWREKTWNRLIKCYIYVYIYKIRIIFSHSFNKQYICRYHYYCEIISILHNAYMNIVFGKDVLVICHARSLVKMEWKLFVCGQNILVLDAYLHNMNTWYHIYFAVGSSHQPGTEIMITSILLQRMK